MAKNNPINEAIDEINSLKEILKKAQVDLKKTNNGLHNELDSYINESLNTVNQIIKEEDEEVDDIETDEVDVDSEIDDIDTDVDSEIEDADEVEDVDSEIEDVVDDIPTNDSEVIDLTNASDDEVLDVFKKLKDDDEIFVTKKNGEMKVQTPQGEYLVKDKTEDSTEMPEIGDEVIDDTEIELPEPEVTDDSIEDTPEPEMDDELSGEEMPDIDGGEESEEGEEDPEVVFEIVDDTINEDSHEKEMKRVKDMGAKDKGHEQSSKTPKEVAPASDASGEKPKEVITDKVKEVNPGSDVSGGKPQEIQTKVPSEANPSEEKIGKLNENLKKLRSELAKSKLELKKVKDERNALSESNDVLQESIKEQLNVIIKINENVNNYKEANKILRENISDMKVIFKSTQNTLDLVTENAVTRNQKVEIRERFKKVNTLEESNRLYNTILEEINSTNNMSTLSRLEENPASGSSNLNEQSVVKNDGLSSYREKFNKLIQK